MPEQTRKRRPQGRQTITISARLYPGEHEALGRLLLHRARRLEAAGQPADDSLVGWIREMIRTQARTEGFEVASSLPAADASAASPGKRRRGGKA